LARLTFRFEFTGIAPHHFAVHEYDGVARLVLRRSGDAAIDRQMRQERANLDWFHLMRVPLVVEQDELLDPADVSLFRPAGQVSHPAGIGHLVEKPSPPRSPVGWK